MPLIEISLIDFNKLKFNFNSINDVNDDLEAVLAYGKNVHECGMKARGRTVAHDIYDRALLLVD